MRMILPLILAARGTVRDEATRHKPGGQRAGRRREVRGLAISLSRDNPEMIAELVPRATLKTLDMERPTGHWRVVGLAVSGGVERFPHAACGGRRADRGSGGSPSGRLPARARGGPAHDHVRG